MKRRFLSILSLLMILVMLFTLPGCRKEVDVPEDETVESTDPSVEGEDNNEESESDDSQDDTDNGDTDNGDTDNGDTDNGDTDNGDTDNGDTDNGETTPCAHATKTYESIDANNHKEKCSSCQTVTVASEAHVYDNDTDTTCNKCNYTRTVSGGNEGGTTTPCTHATKVYESIDDNNHKEKCSTCQTVTVASEAHVYDNDTDTTCNKCNYTRTISGGNEGGTETPCTHATKTYESIDENNHKEKCSSCQTVTVASEAHVYDNDTDTTCNKCNYTRTISGGNEGGTTTPCTHPEAECTWNTTETTHTKVCSCGDTVVATEDHEYTDDADTTCNECGYEREIISGDGDDNTENEPVEDVITNCAHTFTVTRSGENTVSTCSKCTLAITRKEGSIVSVSFGEYWKSNSTTKEPITWTVVATEDGNSLIVSNYILDAVRYHSEDETANKKIAYNDSEIKSWLNGTFKSNAFGSISNGVVIGTINLIPNTVISRDTNALNQKKLTKFAADKLVGLGQNKNENDNWWYWLNPADTTWTQEVNGLTLVTNRVQSSGNPYPTADLDQPTGGVVPAMWINLAGTCGHLYNAENGMCYACGAECAHSVNWDSNDTQHTGTCGICGYVVTPTENHTAGNVCTVCGYGCPHEGEFGWIITDETHQKKCNDCNKPVEAAASHNFGDDSVCDICNHACAHKGGEADCTNKAICELCNKAYGETNDNHKGELIYVSIGDTHQKKYDECGHTVGEAEDHSYVNGVCSICNTACDVEHAVLTTHNCEKCNIFIEHTFNYDATNAYSVCSECGVAIAGTTVGSKVTFGKYQGADIEWTIIAVEGNKALILADKILEGYEYNSDGKSTSYEDSDIRKWLTTTFVNNAFSAAEQKAMIVNTADELNAQDKIFLISNAQAEKLDVADRQKVRTAYASTVIDFDWWWLGESSTKEDANILKYAYAVWSGGNIGTSNYYDPVGQYSTDKGGVVPAMWISLEGDCETHFYNADKKCVICGTECAHSTYTDGVCAECGLVCEHNDKTWDTTHTQTCDECGKKLVENGAHTYENGICGECGNVCQHENYENGVCGDCGSTCPGHEFNGGSTCGKCGFTCENHIFDDESNCTICDYVCTEHTFTDGKCVCGFTCDHDGEDGHNCADCGAFLKHTYNTVDGIRTCTNKDCNVSVATGATVGSKVTFGSYEQDNNTENGEEAISWTIVATDGNKALIVADKILYAYNYQPQNDGTSYANSAIKTWLNKDFKDAAFVGINSYTIVNGEIFLLPNTYTSAITVKQPTAYAIANGAYADQQEATKGNGWWWIQPTENDKKNKVNISGTALETVGLKEIGGVVPAMWIDLNGVCAEHDFDENGQCANCDVKCTEHIGGVATCTEMGECTICGVKYLPMLDHVAVNSATCTEDSKCSCGEVLKEKLGHDFTAKEGDVRTEATKCTEKDTYWYGCTRCDEVSTSEYYEGAAGAHNYITNGYKGADGHADKCEYCDDKKTVVPHTSSGDATETTAETCTVCGYVIKPALGHTCNYDVVKTDEIYHWNECSCGSVDENSKIKHTFDNACDTTCNGGCGYVRATTHNDVLYTSETEHWYACSVCGTEVSGSRASHTWNGDDKCDACEYVCEHNLAAHEACDTCGVAKAHIFNNGVCAGCGIDVKSANVGDQIIFGSYEQDNNTENGKEAISWTIIDKDENGNVLILADKILDGYEYDVESTSYKDSMIREWLTTTFMDNAFSADEQKAMFVNTADTLNAQDKIFLISNAQALKIESANRAKVRTAYAETKLANNWWWLGESSPKTGNECAYAVKGDGTGNISDGYNYVTGVDAGGVVPAMWISLEGECAAHAYGDDSVCDICGEACNHDDLTAHQCADCGYINHDYTTVDGVTTCSVCGVAFTSKEVGGQVTFGNYQGADIKWTIIDTDENGRVLVLANDILDGSNHANISSTIATIQSDAFNDSEDAVIDGDLFLLSAERANELSNRVKVRTAYAETKCDYTWWWLGTAGKDDSYGSAVKGDGAISYGYAKELIGGIVPAMWIQL